MAAAGLNLKLADQRRAQRVKARLKVHFKTPRAFIQEYTANISKGGIFIESDLLLDREDPVEVIVCLPYTNREIRLNGRVAWVLTKDQATSVKRKPGLGLEIVNLPNEDRELFELYIDRITESGPIDE